MSLNFGSLFNLFVAIKFAVFRKSLITYYVMLYIYKYVICYSVTKGFRYEDFQQTDIHHQTSNLLYDCHCSLLRRSIFETFCNAKDLDHMFLVLCMLAKPLLSDLLMEGQVSELGTVHPLLTMSFFRTWCAVVT